jgi:hypothetical protein
MAFHTLAEFVATILIMLIASGSVIGGMFLYFKLRAKELEAQLDLPEADARLGAVEARLRSVETRLGAMEGAIGVLVAGLTQPPAPQTLDAPTRTSATAGAAENVLPLGPPNTGRNDVRVLENQLEPAVPSARSCGNPAVGRSEVSAG